MLITKEGKVPVCWWSDAVNFGDLVAPWLVQKISGREVVYSNKYEHCYVVIGSVLGQVRQHATVWGTGSFGTELFGNFRGKSVQKFSDKARYCAVRGPLTRNKLQMAGIACPRIYGDPALLVPDYYSPQIEKTHEVGIVLRWSENDWFDALNIQGVKKIFLKTDNVEGTIDAMLSCKRLISSSLHGLILADAYGIPNVWLDSRTPKGFEFKFWDYLISVNKTRQPVQMDFNTEQWSLQRMLDELPFDDRKIQIDLQALRDACPFVPGREPDVVVPSNKEKKRRFFLL
ncbi:polysaccharide pyruvyl transferase family protein [Permianibacter sp. IMCC34836]|uniref:polysaccharide pyruvyl transferase family protein n=1 Tax=Permianibacter fluminis TaxID=2738515 RepID=UPI001554CA01|nr:polysaccharide pyruvyl transferase family protein [Permianibacter fluminis]NQD36243.1 polysaccharide pyruvyl transferase family protein [Permianibacter fluminis]